MRLVGWAAVLVLAGCSSPEPVYYALQPVPGAARAGVAGVVQVRKPGLPAMLDRQEIVLEGTDYRLRLSSDARWAEPMGDMVARVLVQDLAQRLPGARLFGEGGALSADPNVRVEIDLQELAADSDGAVHLAGSYALTSAVGHKARGGGRLAFAAPRGAGAAGLAAAMSVVLGEVADRVAEDLAKEDVLF